MSVQTRASRPATKSIATAFVDIVLTLVVLVAVFLTFLVAPLVALALAYLGYVALRPHSRRAEPSGSDRPQTAAHGFGAGAR